MPRWYAALRYLVVSKLVYNSKLGILRELLEKPFTFDVEYKRHKLRSLCCFLSSSWSFVDGLFASWRIKKCKIPILSWNVECVFNLYLLRATAHKNIILVIKCLLLVLRWGSSSHGQDRMTLFIIWNYFLSTRISSTIPFNSYTPLWEKMEMFQRKF